MKHYFLAAFVICLGSCSTNKMKTNEITVNGTIKAIMQQYIDEHPQYNTFMLRQSDEEMFCDSYFPRGYLLGPGYQDIIERQKMKLFIQFDNARVYVEDYMNGILPYDSYSKWENTNPRDSFFVPELNVALRSSGHKYIYKAIFIYYENDKVKVNSRPDTIFVVQQVKSKIKFTPVY